MQKARENIPQEKSIFVLFSEQSHAYSSIWNLSRDVLPKIAEKKPTWKRLKILKNIAKRLRNRTNEIYIESTFDVSDKDC